MNLTLCLLQGALLVQNLVSDKASQTTLEASYKQYYLSLGAAAALLRWYRANS